MKLKNTLYSAAAAAEAARMTRMTTAQQVREALRSPEVAALWNAQAQRVIRPGNKHRINKRQSHKGPHK